MCSFLLSPLFPVRPPPATKVVNPSFPNYTNLSAARDCEPKPSPPPPLFAASSRLPVLGLAIPPPCLGRRIPFSLLFSLYLCLTPTPPAVPSPTDPERERSENKKELRPRQKSSIPSPPSLPPFSPCLTNVPFPSLFLPPLWSWFCNQVLSVRRTSAIVSRRFLFSETNSGNLSLDNLVINVIDIFQGRQ